MIGAVGRILIGLDDDQLFLLGLENRLETLAHFLFADLDAVQPDRLVGLDAEHRLVLRLRLARAVDGDGKRTSTPFCSSGAMIIMMMSSTSMTSTSGVTLMSDLIRHCHPVALP